MILFLYRWLKNNKTINIFLIIAYYLLVVLPHEKIGSWITNNLDQPYGRATYNLSILIIGLIGLFSYSRLVWQAITQFEQEKKAWFVFSITLFLIIISFNSLLTVNVEIIHFVQYAIFAILLFPLLNNYRDTLFYAMLFAAIDESYQYFVLAPLRTDYFDFNDVIIDLIGAALGLLLFWINDVKDVITNQKWFQTPTFIGFSILIIIFILAYSVNIIAIYPSETEAPILLIRKLQENFWTITHPNIKFHVVRPLEGTLILILLFYFYTRQVFGSVLIKKRI